MILFLLASMIPAIFLVEIGRSSRPIADQPESFPGWAGFLSIGLGLLIGTALLALTVLGESGSLIVLMILPSMCALFAESCLYIFTFTKSLISRQPITHLRRHAGLLLVILLMLAALGFLVDKFILQAVVYGGAFLAAGWLIWNRLGRWFALTYPLLLLLLLLSVWAVDTQSEFLFLPANLAPITRTLVGLVPGLGVIVSCSILAWTLSDKSDFTARRLIPVGLLIVPLILLLAWYTATASAWDVATDGLGGIFILELTSVFGFATAIHQSWSLSHKQNSFVFGCVVLILVFVMGANSFGTFGLDGEWGNVPRARTTRRAQMINQAILRYYEEQGKYPQTLTDLTPGYLLYLPTPFIIPHQNWCYQSGSDYYRLGYVERDYFSTPASVKVYAAAGQPSNPAWACDAEAAKYPAPPG